MIEESKQDEQLLRTFQIEKKAYKDGIYDFTFQDRFIIYHFFLAGFYTYIALDKKTGYGSQVTKTQYMIKPVHYKYLTPAILFSIKYTGDSKYLGAASISPDRFIEMMFRQIMPRYGFTVREEQIRLCKCMYEGLNDKRIALCEAEVGTGKTMAYLIAGLALKLCNRTNMIDHTPVTISTSSIELQQAIITKEIPMLTKMLTESGLLARSIHAVVRKGKKHYFCLARYEDYYDSLRKHPRKYSETLALLNKLCLPMNAFDLDMIPQLKAYIKAKICVKGNCNQCKQAGTCEYADFVRRSKTERLDFQITNHNLLLVSQRIKSISDDGSGILKETPYCIIDEAHKLLDAAESVFGSEFDQGMIPEYLDSVRNTCDNEKSAKEYRALIRTARGVHKSMIHSLWEDRDPETEDDTKGRYLLHLSKQSAVLIEKMLETLELIGGYKQNQPHPCGNILSLLRRYLENDNSIFWVTAEQTEEHTLFLTFSCLPKHLSEEVYKHMWGHKETHFCLTSGTMCDDTGFSYFKDENGINNNISPLKITETTCASPFDYTNHSRLYISDRVCHPDADATQYLREVSDEIERLIRATSGHTAILFTSYKVLAEVYARLKTRITEYPMICMSKSNRDAIRQFKESINGVLFASGSMWEGVDCAGDILSSVIIVRLPFPLRTEALEQKKEKCKSVQAFVQRYAVPQMIIKLRQGAGRLIRNETDTGVISILDARAAVGGPHRKRILNAMAKYPLVKSIDEINAFIRQVKTEDYFGNYNEVHPG